MPDDATFENLEESLEKRATGPFKRVYALLIHTLEQAWPGDDAPPKDKFLALRQIDLGLFDGLAQPLVEMLLDGAESALAEGFGAGLDEARDSGVEPSVFRTSISREVVDASRSMPDKIHDKVRLAKRALSNAVTLDEAKMAVSVAGSTINTVSMTASYVANQSANDARQHVADLDPELVSVVEPERDACVKCLNHAGKTNPERRPPFHPRCRCKLRVLEIQTSKPVVAAIKREADRSILRGWSRPGESEKVRLDAAKKLLAKNPNMPKSVKDYARTAIKRGEFPRGRAFPGD